MIRDLLWLVGTTLFYGLLFAYLITLIPAAVLMARRKAWAYFAAGFVTFGLAWLFGAFQIVRLSRNQKLITVAALLLFGFLAARPALLVGVDGKSLQQSVGTFMTSRDSCDREGNHWICANWDDRFSGAIGYRVKVDSFGCWEGTALERSAAQPKIYGCVTLMDLN